MLIEPKTVVTITYHLKVRGGQGQEEISIQETNEKDPFIFLFGAGQLIPGFEINLQGKTAGESFDFWIPASEGYGEKKDENIIPFSIENFLDENGKFDSENIKVGNYITLMDQQGNQFQALVHHVGLEQVTLDFNHELAGKDLHFTGKVIHVRRATDEELSDAMMQHFD